MQLVVDPGFGSLVPHLCQASRVFYVQLYQRRLQEPQGMARLAEVNWSKSAGVFAEVQIVADELHDLKRLKATWCHSPTATLAIQNIAEVSCQGETKAAPPKAGTWKP